MGSLGSELGVSVRSERKGVPRKPVWRGGQGIGMSLSLQLQTPPLVTGRAVRQRERWSGEKDGIAI